MGWPLIYNTPLGMFCLYGKVMRDVNENERGIDERIIVQQVKDFGQECGTAD